EIGPLVDRPDQVDEESGVVRKVRVHLEQPVVLTFESPGKTSQVGAAQAFLLCPVEYVDAWVQSREVRRQPTGAVRRVVVHDQDFETRVLLQDPRYDLGQVLALVIGGQNHQQALSHWRRLASGSVGRATAGRPR